MLAAVLPESFPKGAPRVDAESNAAPVISAPAPPLQRPTPGWKTTEFWISGAVVALSFASAILDLLPAEKAALVSGLVSAGYGALRLVLKLRLAARNVQAFEAAVGAQIGDERWELTAK